MSGRKWPENIVQQLMDIWIFCCRRKCQSKFVFKCVRRVFLLSSTLTLFITKNFMVFLQKFSKIRGFLPIFQWRIKHKTAHERKHFFASGYDKLPWELNAGQLIRRWITRSNGLILTIRKFMLLYVFSIKKYTLKHNLSSWSHLFVCLCIQCISNTASRMNRIGAYMIF